MFQSINAYYHKWLRYYLDLCHKLLLCKKSLLAALLRANRIPAGLCYQRLTIENNKPLFCLHGLNAVYLPDTGWYRIDARGNKEGEGVDADFTPPKERLAFSIAIDGEADFQEIWSKPLPEVTENWRHQTVFWL